MHLPAPRGPLSAHLVDVLAGEVVLDATTVAVARAAAGTSAPLTDDDLHLSLWMLYELHYRGFDGVDDGWEWEPQLLAVRRELETVYERALRTACRKAVDAGVAVAGPDADLPEQLFGLVSSFDGPSLAKHLHREATAEQFKEVLVHRSIYQLKEADPHTWTIPRLPDGPKVALVELQYDEYGAGRAHRQHSHLFAEGMAACGLDRTYGAYVDAVPGLTLALSNAMSLFGLHRRLRGASVGHLAALEATSSLPCKKYVGGIRRLDLPEEIAEYFDEHVEADAVHEQVAVRDICGALVEQQPELRTEVLFGAAACLLTDSLLAEHVLTSWQLGLGSLRQPQQTEAVA